VGLKLSREAETEQGESAGGSRARRRFIGNCCGSGKELGGI